MEQRNLNATNVEFFRPWNESAGSVNKLLRRCLKKVEDQDAVVVGVQYSNDEEGECVHVFLDGVAS